MAIGKTALNSGESSYFCAHWAVLVKSQSTAVHFICDTIPIMKKHEWRETTEDGEKRLVTATRHAGKWKLRSRLKSETEWTEHPVIALEDLETLKEIIEKKYQRSRLPYGQILEVDALIEKAKPRK